MQKPASAEYGCAARRPGRYGARVISDDGSGRTGIGRDRAVGQGNIRPPISYRCDGEGGHVRHRALWQVAHNGTGATGKAADTMVIMMMRRDTRRMLLLMNTRFEGCHRCGNADRAATYQGNRAQHHEQTSAKPSHHRNLSCLVTVNNRRFACRRGHVAVANPNWTVEVWANSASMAGPKFCKNIRLLQDNADSRTGWRNCALRMGCGRLQERRTPVTGRASSQSHQASDHECSDLPRCGPGRLPPGVRTKISQHCWKFLQAPDPE